MAAFSRRTLQRLIDENASFLSKKQTRKHVHSLNGINAKPSLATEWEVVLINAFSKLGNIVHEKDFGGSNRGDLYFEEKSDPTQRFLADITTISEQPDTCDTLLNELTRIIGERGLRRNSFNLRVGAVKESDRRVGFRIRLKIPSPARFKELIFNDEFEAFMLQVAQDINENHTYTINKHEIELTIEYNPRQTSASSGIDHNLNPHYIGKYPLTHNTLYWALERKGSQLKGTNFNGPLGILVCDSHNSLLWKASSTGLSRTTEDIVYSYLRTEEAISFVILVGIHYIWADCIDVSYWARDQERYQIAFYLFKGNKFEQVEYVQDIVELLPDVLPKPIQSPVNAINWLRGRWAKEGMSFRGGCEMALGNNVNSIKISSRALLELLSGKVSQQEFFELHDFTRPGLPEHTTRNPFRLALSNHQLFSKMSLQKSDSKDDDWITFEFGEPDPAVGPFTEPSRKG